MATVYILQSEKNGKYYIGSTKDLDQRIQQHLKGRVLSTKSNLPWKLVFKQNFESVGVARKQEIRLKGLKRRDYIEKVISDGVTSERRLRRSTEGGGRSAD